MHACILLKDRKAEDDYVTALYQSAGFAIDNIHCTAVLGHQLCALDDLHQAFRFGQHSGLIFTSQRAVEAWSTTLSRAQDEDQSTQTRWSQVPHYVVGQATATSLLSLPSEHAPTQSQVLGQDSGHADALAEFIATNHTAAKAPLLYLTGDKRRDVIPEALNKANIAFREICVYQTATDPAFASNFTALVDGYSATHHTESQTQLWIVLFSPSGANAALPLLQERQHLWRNNRLSLAALGPTTATHLQKEFDIEPHAVASSPKPDLLAQAIKDAML